MEPSFVEIYLHVEGSLLSFLSIPLADVQRLAVRPLKWLRFVMFCICGARGELSATSGGLPVNYENESLDERRYFYKPWNTEDFCFVDPHALDRVRRSTGKASRSSAFQQSIVQRDGSCVITGEASTHCEAAHLIPKEMGHKYLCRVCQLRSRHYTEPLSIPDVDAIQNGVLLRRDVCLKLRYGEVAFVRTPNFAMGPDDIHRVEQGSPHGGHVTLQQLKVSPDFDQVSAQCLVNQRIKNGKRIFPVAYALEMNIDARFSVAGEAAQHPPAAILDFAYGVATYNQWKSRSVHDVVDKYHTDHFAALSLSPSSGPSVHDGGDLEGDGIPRCEQRRQGELDNVMMRLEI